MKNEIIAKNFYKSYSQSKSLFENVNFKMEGGCIYGLVAPNGFGKTTLMKCIAGLSSFNGSIEYNGFQVGSHLYDQIVYSPSTPIFENYSIKVVECLRSVAILRGIPFKNALANFRNSQSAHLENSVCKKLSTGQKKLFQLFLDFLSGPEIILLDEPLNGLDYNVRNLVVSNLSLLAKSGKIILISTHIFSDIETVTDKFFIISNKTLNFYEGKKISEAYDNFFPAIDSFKKEGKIDF